MGGACSGEWPSEELVESPPKTMAIVKINKERWLELRNFSKGRVKVN